MKAKFLAPLSNILQLFKATKYLNNKEMKVRYCKN
jgi:hypothetical protein